MLARTIAWVCGCAMMSSGVFAEDLKPNIIVVLSQGSKKVDVSVQDATYPVFDEQILLGVGKKSGAVWRGYRWDSRASPGKASSLSAVLLRRHPICSGVVSDRDWRRKPVAGNSLAELFRKCGYNTGFTGRWPMGLDETHHPSALGFDECHLASTGRLNEPWKGGQVGQRKPQKDIDLMIKVMNGEGPAFLVIHGSSVQIAKAIREQSERSYNNKKRGTIIVVIRVNTDGSGAVRGHISGEYSYPSDSFVYHCGEMVEFINARNSLRSAKTDWEMGVELGNRLSDQKTEQSQFRFFHKANWPANESPEKYRHRGSLVVGNGHALVDGLELYPATKTLEPDLTQPHDIATHQKIHSEMLMAHTIWWKKAREALHNPRPFSVGSLVTVGDKKTTQLTAMDWRLSKIIHTDGSVPSYKPVLYQKNLLAILKGLQDEEYRNSFPAYSGSWSVNVMRAGRYKITASLLPKEATKPEEKILAKLQGGQAFFKLGRNKVQLNLVKGASSVSVLVDADAGVQDLECWFTGQLALERELGAFFVEIERVGDKKFDLKAKEQ